MFGNGRYPDANERLDVVVETMKEISLQSDPQALVQVYAKRMAQFLASDGFLSTSRRDLKRPQFRVTRSNKWAGKIDPWRDKDKLPVLTGGIIADLMYSDEPHMLEVLKFPKDDPAYEYLPEDCHFLVAIPHFDMGEALNYVFHFYRAASAFDPQNLPEMVWMSNLFGRGVNNLVLSRDLQVALGSLDKELKKVEEMQQSLLPQQVPPIPTLKLAAHYQTSRHAGGDYYDFFNLGDDHWGLLLADVSGHGTPAAVVMAVTHALAHNYPGSPTPPGIMMHYLNQKLCALPTSATGNFVTAVYANYNARDRTLTYSSAGHPEIRLLREGLTVNACVESLHLAKSLPLGIDEHERFHQATVQLKPGDRFCLYTDGITESFNPAHEMFGVERLDEALQKACRGPNPEPQEMINAILESVGAFCGHPRGEDDRTIITAIVT